MAPENYKAVRSCAAAAGGDTRTRSIACIPSRRGRIARSDQRLARARAKPRRQAFLGVELPRLFTGLEVPAEAAATLEMKRGGLHGARWVDPENYHITVRFIGDVDRAVGREIAAALGRLSGFAPFRVSVTHLGAFGGNRPRTIYAGLEFPEALSRLHAAQERILRRLGLEPDSRRFTPHVTLARLRDVPAREVARYLSGQGQVQPLRFDVSRFVLFSSRESVGGGPYVIEGAYDLAA